jgi:hypothetical protein
MRGAMEGFMERVQYMRRIISGTIISRAGQWFRVAQEVQGYWIVR